MKHAPVFLAALMLTPSQLVANPASYEGKAVTVSGTVEHFQKTKSLFKTVSGFQLCDTQCIVVVDETNAAHSDGEKTSVSGTFQQNFKGPKRSFKNVVVIR
jgi:hypothetical protein